MRCFYGATIVAAALAGGCSRGGRQPAASAPEPAGTPFEDLVVRTPLVYGNLAIFPIVSQTDRMADRFITLDEGLAAGTVKIVEVGAAEAAADPSSADVADDTPSEPAARQGDAHSFDDLIRQIAEPAGEVNRLMVLNTSGRPLYLMPGEVISGGKHDRTIGEELVIEPGEQPVPIDVFCVEHARWSSRAPEQTSQLLAALSAHDVDSLIPFPDAGPAVGREAAEGKFVAPAGQAGKDLRLTILQSEGQLEVWDNVAELNSKVGSETETGTLAAAYADEDVNRRLKPYLNHLGALGDTERIVGAAVSINGRLCSADVFESTPLFRKFWPKLLKSYALDAIAEGGEYVDEGPQPCTAEQCVAFLKEAAAAKPETTTADHGTHTRRETAGAISFSYSNLTRESVGVPGRAALGNEDMDRPTTGGFGGAVHSGVFAK